MVDGIGNGLALDRCRHVKVFQVVVDEVDGVAMGHATELLQSRGHRHVVEVAAHTLGMDLDGT